MPVKEGDTIGVTTYTSSVMSTKTYLASGVPIFGRVRSKDEFNPSFESLWPISCYRLPQHETAILALLVILFFLLLRASFIGATGLSLTRVDFDRLLYVSSVIGMLNAALLSIYLNFNFLTSICSTVSLFCLKTLSPGEFRRYTG